MAHTHHDVEVVGDGGAAGFSAGMLALLATVLVIAIIAFAVLWTRPWDSNGSTNNNGNPGISDNSGGGQSGGGGDSGGGAQPAQ